MITSVSKCERCGEPTLPNSLHICNELWPLTRLRPAPKPTGVDGIGSLVVGYRAGHPIISDNRKRFGIEPRDAGKCYGGCGHNVWFYSGGIDTIRDRDAHAICTVCKQESYGEIMAEL